MGYEDSAKNPSQLRVVLPQSARVVREGGWSSNSNQEIAGISAQSFTLPPTRSAPPILCENLPAKETGAS